MSCYQSSRPPSKLAGGVSWRGLGPGPWWLAQWEQWAAELLESHLSFPVLGFYRSQHNNQSWVGALSLILDTAALLVAGVECGDGHQARLTFAMARHAGVDLALVVNAPPLPPVSDRLPEARLSQLLSSLREAGVGMAEPTAVAKALAELRYLYEPFVNAPATHFEFPLPAFLPDAPPVDNWQTSPKMPRSPGLGGLPAAGDGEHHFD